MSDHHNVRSRNEIAVHINLLEDRKNQIVEELKGDKNIPGLSAELVRVEAKMDALHWALHNSKARLHESFYGKEATDTNLSAYTTLVYSYQRLKKSIVRFLSKEKDLEKPYLVSPGRGKTYSKGDIIHEIENDTDMGMETVEKMVILACDLFDRAKEKPEGLERVEEEK